MKIYRSGYCLGSLLCFLSLISSYSAAEDKDVNLVPNPGFEDTTVSQGGGGRGGWYIWGIDNPKIDTEVKHGGKNSFSASAEELYPFGKSRQMFRTDITLKSQKTYIISGYYKSAGLTESIVEISIGLTPADGKCLWYSVKIPLTGTTDWIYVEKEITTPANLVKVLFAPILVHNGYGTIWVDDVAIRPVKK